MQVEFRVIAPCLALAFSSACLAENAAAFSKAPEVASFLGNKENCEYMLDIPDKQSDIFVKRFSTDIDAAVVAMQKIDPALTRTDSLLILKKLCDPAPLSSGKTRN